MYNRSNVTIDKVITKLKIIDPLFHDKWLGWSSPVICELDHSL